MDSELLLVFGIFVACTGWVLAVVVVVAHTPPRPPAGPKTLDLGPEPPAVANSLVHDFTVTADAIPATLIDLSARNVLDIEQRGPDVFYVRVRKARGESLAAYERRVLEHLVRHSRDGVMPAAALTTGPPDESTRWQQDFRAAVVTDAKARGLSTDAVDGGVFTVLSMASVVPATVIGLTTDLQWGGFASGASRPLPMGVESDTHAWSAYSGRWRPVRISYPRVWPPGWGKDPMRAVAASLVVLVGSVSSFTSSPRRCFREVCSARSRSRSLDSGSCSRSLCS